MTPHPLLVSTAFKLLVRELLEAGNQLADLISDPPTTEAETEDAERRWERAVAAVGEL